MMIIVIIYVFWRLSAAEYCYEEGCGTPIGGIRCMSKDGVTCTKGNFKVVDKVYDYNGTNGTLICRKGTTRNLVRENLDNFTYVHDPTCNCLLGNCSGTDEYCMMMGCELSSSCFCDLKTVYSELSEGTLINKMIYRKHSSTLRFGEFLRPWDPRDMTGKKRVTGTITMTWAQPTISIFGNGLEGVILSATSGDITQMRSCAFSNVCTMDLDPTLLKLNAVTISVVESGVILLHQVVQVSEVEYCLDPGCLLCSDLFDNWNCYSSAMQAGLVFGIIMIILLMLFGVMLAVLAARWLWMRRHKLSSTEAAIVATTMCLLLACPADAQLVGCNSHTSTIGMIPDCLLMGNTLNCSITGQVVMDFQYIGQKSCFTLYTEDNVWLADMTVEYVYHTKEFQTEVDYYTSNWQLYEYSIRYCAHTVFSGSEFCDHDAVDCTTNPSDPARSGAITGDTLLFPGESTCMDSCGCAGCDCFSCDSACTYGRWAIYPVPSVWEVRSIENRGVSRPVVRWCARTNEMDWACDVSIVDTEFYMFGNHTTYTSGWSREVVNSMGELKPIIGLSEATLDTHVASLPNLPMRGMIGDVQASTPEAFTSAVSQSSFIFDPTICDGTLADGGLIYRCSTPGAMRINAGLTNILTGNGEICSLQSGASVSCMSPFANPFRLALEFDGSDRISRVFTQICPEGEFISVAGCHSCRNGGSILLNLKSTCLEGTVVVTANGFTLNNASITLTRNRADYVLSIDSSTKNLRGAITIYGSGAPDLVLDVVGLLQDPVLDINGNELGYFYNNTSDIDSWNWGQRIGLIVGVSIAAIVVLAIIAGVVMFLLYKSGTVAEYMILN